MTNAVKHLPPLHGGGSECTKKKLAQRDTEQLGRGAAGVSPRAVGLQREASTSKCAQAPPWSMRLEILTTAVRNAQGSRLPVRIYGTNMQPSKTRGSCMFYMEGGNPCNIASPGNSFLWPRNFMPLLRAMDTRKCPEPGALSGHKETDSVWALLGAHTAAVDTADGLSEGWLHPRDMRHSPQTGAVSTGLFTPAGTNMCSEPLPRHQPGCALPLQLMGFQMKGKISCALDLRVVSWILLTSS